MPTLIKSSTIDETKFPSDYYSDKREQDRSGTGSWSISVVKDAWYAFLVFSDSNQANPGISSGLTSTSSSSRVTVGDAGSYGYLIVGKTTGTSVTLNGYTRHVRAIRIG